MAITVLPGHSRNNPMPQADAVSARVPEPLVARLYVRSQCGQVTVGRWGPARHG